MEIFLEIWSGDDPGHDALVDRLVYNSGQMAGLLRTPDHNQTVRQVSPLNVENPERAGAHQEDTETDENGHGVNEWLAHEPAFSGRIVSGRHVAASGVGATGSKTIENTICTPSAGNLQIFSAMRVRSGESEGDRSE